MKFFQDSRVYNSFIINKNIYFNNNNNTKRRSSIFIAKNTLLFFFFFAISNIENRKQEK